MTITAADVKALREATGAGMMDCKKALTETDGDIEAAKKLLRQKGLADVSKRSARTAGEGLVAALMSDDGRSASMIELACETDFVAKGERFTKLADDVAAAVFEGGDNPPDALDTAIADLVESAAVDLREKVEYRAGVFYRTENGALDAYLHRTGGWARMGVLVEVEGEGVDEATLKTLSHEIALHVQFARPDFLEHSEVPGDLVAREQEIAEAKARNDGKPDNIIPRIVEGAVQKLYKDRVLLEQPYIKEDKKSVAKWLDGESGGKARIARFARFEVGTGADADADGDSDEE